MEWYPGASGRQCAGAPGFTESPPAPVAKYPQQLEDVFGALKWVYENIGRYGGSNRKIFLGGHSSGGHLAALAAMRTDLLWAAVGRDPGLLSVSSPLDLRLEKCESGGRREKQVKLFLDRDSQDREASVIEYATRATTPMLLAWGRPIFRRS
jgi:acetyl esterase/lipase